MPFTAPGRPARPTMLKYECSNDHCPGKSAPEEPGKFVVLECRASVDGYQPIDAAGANLQVTTDELRKAGEFVKIHKGTMRFVYCLDCLKQVAQEDTREAGEPALMPVDPEANRSLTEKVERLCPVNYCELTPTRCDTCMMARFCKRRLMPSDG